MLVELSCLFVRTFHVRTHVLDQYSYYTFQRSISQDMLRLKFVHIPFVHPCKRLSMSKSKNIAYRLENRLWYETYSSRIIELTRCVKSSTRVWKPQTSNRTRTILYAHIIGCIKSYDNKFPMKFEYVRLIINVVTYTPISRQRTPTCCHRFKFTWIFAFFIFIIGYTFRGNI
jgi:hypothetical protein